MAAYRIYRHPVTGQLDAVKQGYAFWAMVMNVLGIGFVWAFVKRANGFAWRLLAVTIIAVILVFISGSFAGAIALLWIALSGTIGNMAYRQVEHGLKRRGFVVLSDKVQASSADAAIDRATAAGAPAS